MKNLVKNFCIAGVVAMSIGSVAFANEEVHLEKGSWAWTGFFGSYDKEKAQRGLQVFTEVCAGCHSLSLLPIRELAKLGYNEAELKGFASKFEVANGVVDGKMTKRRATPSDTLPNPFESEDAARAGNNGALPPDLSLIINSRAHGRNNFFLNFWDAIRAQDNASGADYVYNLLISYDAPPSDFAMGAGMNYNKIFPGKQIAMAAPLSDGQVTYADGTKASKEQMAEDVVNFLAFVSQPNLELQKAMGIKVLLFLIVFFVLLLATKRKIWSNAKK